MLCIDTSLNNHWQMDSGYSYVFFSYREGERSC